MRSVVAWSLGIFLGLFCLPAYGMDVLDLWAALPKRPVCGSPTLSCSLDAAFAQTDVGSNDEAILTCTNNGTELWTYRGYTLATGTEFTVQSASISAGTTVAPGASFTMTLRFAPVTQ